MKIGKVISLVVGVFVLFGVFSVSVFAEEVVPPAPPAGVDAGASGGGTLLPATSLKTEDCRSLMSYVAGHPQKVIDELFKDRSGKKTYIGISGVTANAVLACGIRTGDIKLWMVPYYIRFILEFVIGLAGLIAVGGIVYGGYLYLFAGISDDKDKGKKAIMYGVVGMIITLVAWAVVNIFIAFLTWL